MDPQNRDRPSAGAAQFSKDCGTAQHSHFTENHCSPCCSKRMRKGSCVRGCCPLPGGWAPCLAVNEGWHSCRKSQVVRPESKLPPGARCI